MKQTLQPKQTIKQKLKFNTALYDSLDILKLSSVSLMESIFEAVQENPLLEIEETYTSFYESYDMFRTISKPISLKESLFSQLHTCSYAYDDIICTYLIESLDEHGFFVENLDECASMLCTTQQELMKQLSIIRSFEPCGVAAFNCIHALSLQARAHQHMLAFHILDKSIHELSHKQYNKIAKKLHCTEKDIHSAIHFIQTLTPYPCSSFKDDDNIIIFPDVHLEVLDGKINLRPNNYIALRYNDDYVTLMGTNPILKKYFEQSKVLMMNIDKRNATMMLVTNEIVNRQSGYFLYHDELKPLIQSEIAQTIGMNQATVSRAIMEKYYEFENEVYPISQLFVTATTQGDSSDAIKKAIKEIISHEDKYQPYSDQQIVDKLIGFDYHVSRRTVTKYRESYGIQNTRERRKR